MSILSLKSITRPFNQLVLGLFLLAGPPLVIAQNNPEVIEPRHANQIALSVTAGAVVVGWGLGRAMEEARKTQLRQP